MQYGVCSGPEIVPLLAHTGFDYIEMGVGSLLKPREDHASFASSLQAVRALGLPCPAANLFVPGDLKITGPDVDPSALKQYVTTTFERAHEAGVEVIVFGSGGARGIPDGFDRTAAQDQLIQFCAMLAPIALEHSVTVAVEPLNSKDCNVLTAIHECATLVRTVDHPAVRLLVDAYHLLKDDDPLEEIVQNGDLLAHVHIATEENRLPPGAEPCDLAPFFDALVQAGYDGRISIEARMSSPDSDLPRALSHMKTLEQEAKVRNSMS